MTSFAFKHGLLASFLLFIIGCDTDSNSGNKPKPPIEPTDETQYIYISTNDIDGNQVVGFSIDDEGGLTEFDAPFDTGGYGDAEDGDFDAQGAIRIIGDHLLVVNPGETMDDPSINEGNGSISVFEINPDNGQLTRIDQNDKVSGIQNIDSGGVRPVSLDFTVINDKTWVVVGNMQDGPLCVNPSSSNDLETCTDQYHRSLSEYLNDNADQQRSINLFQFENGKLTFVSNIDNYTPKVSGAAQVSFSPDRTKLAVTTLGIGYDAFASEELQLQTPSHTFIYDIATTDNGNLSFNNRRYFANPKIAFSIGFSWSPDSRFLFVSNAILQSDATSAQVMTLDTQDMKNVFTSDKHSIPTATGTISINDDEATCWTWITPDGKRLYAIAANTNVIASFQISDEGALTLEHTTQRQGAFIPESTDVFVTANQKNMYVVANVGTFSIATFDIDENGHPIEKSDSPLKVKASRKNNQIPDAKNEFYLGIAGYPNFYTGF